MLFLELEREELRNHLLLCMSMHHALSCPWPAQEDACQEGSVFLFPSLQSLFSVFSLSLSFSPDFPPPLCMAPSVTPRPVNQHLEGEEEDFLQWARNEARQGQKGKCASPPPRLLFLLLAAAHFVLTLFLVAQSHSGGELHVCGQIGGICCVWSYGHRH